MEVKEKAGNLKDECTASRPSLDFNRDRSKCFNRSVCKTVLVFSGYACTGLICSLSGSTFVHLELLMLCDTSDMSFTLTLQSAGSLLGSFICILLATLSSPELKMFLFLALVALVTVVSTMYTSIYWFLAFTTIQGCGLAFYNSVSQSYIIQLWINHRLKNPILQATHAVWSLGVALGPFIIAYFLVDISSTLRFLQDANESNNTNSSVQADDESLNRTGRYHLSTASDITDGISVYGESATVIQSSINQTVDPIDVSLVRYAYVAIGLPMFLPAFAFLYVHLTERSRRAELLEDIKKVDTKLKKSSINGEILPFVSVYNKVILIVLVILFYIFYACLEIIPRGFLTTFTAKYLGWSTRNSTLINSIYSGCLFAGRLVGVPLSAILRPKSILAVNLVIILAASLFMLLAEWYDGVLVWPAAGLLGYGVSTTFGSMILWFSEKLSVTGSLVALFMIATSVGGMLGPPLVGQLFDRYSPMWMVYVILIVAICMVVIYVIMVVMEMQRRHRPASNPSHRQSNIPLKGGGDDVIPLKGGCNDVEHSKCETQT